MKRYLLPLGLSLSLALVACSPASGPATAPESPAVETPNQATQIQAESYDVKLLVAGENGAVNPLTPENIAELKLDGQKIANTDMIQVGTAAAEALSKSDSAQQELMDKVSAGESQVIFAGGGVYSFIAPISDKSNQLEVTLKDSGQSYQVELVNGLNQGIMVLNMDGKVQGTYSLEAGFEVKQAGGLGDFLGDLLAGVGIDLGSASGGGTIGGEGAEDEVKEKDAAASHSLAAYTGHWTLASDLLLSLVPGGKLEVEFHNVSESTYQGTAHLAAGSFTGQGTVDDLEYTDNTVTLKVSASGKSIDLKLTSNGPNSVSATLLSANDLPEVNSFIGVSVDLKRLL